MKYCGKCGKQVMDEAVICPGCGYALEKTKPAANFVPKKAKTAKIFGALSCLLLAPFGIPAIILAVQSKNETGGVMCKEAKNGLIGGILGLSFWGIAILTLLQ